MLRKKIHGSCAKYSGRELQLCKMKMADHYISYLRTELSKCDKSLNPSLCKNKIEIAINKEKIRYNKQQQKLNKSLVGRD
jgi:hypothetical protein